MGDHIFCMAWNYMWISRGLLFSLHCLQNTSNSFFGDKLVIIQHTGTCNFVGCNLNLCRSEGSYSRCTYRGTCTCVHVYRYAQCIMHKEDLYTHTVCKNSYMILLPNGLTNSQGFLADYCFGTCTSILFTSRYNILEHDCPQCVCVKRRKTSDIHQTKRPIF